MFRTFTRVNSRCSKKVIVCKLKKEMKKLKVDKSYFASRLKNNHKIKFQNLFFL